MVIPKFRYSLALNHSMFMQNKCHKHEFFWTSMPTMNHEWSCFWFKAWESMIFRVNIFAQALFNQVHCQWTYKNWAWTEHELCMKLLWLWSQKAWKCEQIFPNCMAIAREKSIVFRAWTWYEHSLEHGTIVLSLLSPVNIHLKHVSQYEIIGQRYDSILS